MDSEFKKEEEISRHHIYVAFASLFALISIGTLSYQFLEGWTWVQSFYFSVVTLATVGYGDLHPTNNFSMIFTAFYVFIGVGITASSLTVIATDRITNTTLRMRRFAKILKEKRSINSVKKDEGAMSDSWNNF